MGSIFETIMLLCFGAAWPVSIYKSYTSKSVKGKSVLFLIIIIMGYAAGIVHKLYYTEDKKIALYVINMIMVSIDLMLYFRNKKMEETA